MVQLLYPIRYHIWRKPMESSFPIQSRIKIKQAEKLKQIAEAKGYTLSLLVRTILIEYLEKNQ